MAIDDLIKHSVTRDDIQPANTGVLHWILNYSMMNSVNECPSWWSPARDYFLRNTINRETAWAGAVSIAITKVTSQGWDLSGDQPRIRNAYHEIIMQWMMDFASRDILDFLTTDNGCFTEIVRATSGVGSRIIGLINLDSLRCTRTGDPEIPVLYQDLKGAIHAMKAHQVMMLSDLPDASENWNGVGHCAAGRAISTILKMESIERYIYEKVSGKRPLAVHIVNGIAENNLRTAMNAADEDSKRKGQVVYMGAAVIPTLSDIQPQLLTIPLAELPDGFDRKAEFDMGMLLYANCLGLDPQDLQPLTGQSLGSGAQSVVLHEKAQGRGLAAYRQQKTHMLNENVLPGTTTFAFSEDDLRDQRQRADIAAVEVNTHVAQITAGIITAQQAAQMEADDEIIPREFVPIDVTPGGTISDAEKPEAVSAAEQTQTPTDETPIPEPVTKESLQARFFALVERFEKAMVQ